VCGSEVTVNQLADLAGSKSDRSLQTHFFVGAGATAPTKNRSSISRNPHSALPTGTLRINDEAIKLTAIAP